MIFYENREFAYLNTIESILVTRILKKEEE